MFGSVLQITNPSRKLINGANSIATRGLAPLTTCPGWTFPRILRNRVLEKCRLRLQTTVTMLLSGGGSNRKEQSASVNCGDSVPRGHSWEGRSSLHLDQWADDRKGRIICLCTGLRSQHSQNTPHVTHRNTMESKKRSEPPRSPDVIT